MVSTTAVSRNEWFSLPRVIAPGGAMLYSASKVDPSLPLGPAEALIGGRGRELTLNIDSASFHQLRDVCHDDPAQIGAAVKQIVDTDGRMKNPVTGSGGVLLGEVTEVGPAFPSRKYGFGVGDRVTTLISLTVTPLHIERVIDVNVDTEKVVVEGHAILPASGLAAKMPTDMSESVALAALDIAGAPAFARQYVQPDQTVLVIGAGGKSGHFIMDQARAKLGLTGKLIGLDVPDRAISRMMALGAADNIIRLSATEPLAVQDAIGFLTGGRMADLVINVSSRPNTEMASVMSMREGGQTLFFGMATSFSAAALGTEGIGHYGELLIGTGYLPGHANLTLDIIRHNPHLRALLEEIYVKNNQDFLPHTGSRYRQISDSPFPIWQRDPAV